MKGWPNDGARLGGRAESACRDGRGIGATVLKILPRGVGHPAWGNLIDADLWPGEAVHPGRAATFADNYLDLVENGYEVVAIRPGEKRPTPQEPPIAIAANGV
jgi:hypothetical protein